VLGLFGERVGLHSERRSSRGSRGDRADVNSSLNQGASVIARLSVRRNSEQVDIRVAAAILEGVADMRVLPMLRGSSRKSGSALKPSPDCVGRTGEDQFLEGVRAIPTLVLARIQK
jgi:hypothetical protein